MARSSAWSKKTDPTPWSCPPNFNSRQHAVIAPLPARLSGRSLLEAFQAHWTASLRCKIFWRKMCQMLFEIHQGIVRGKGCKQQSSMILRGWCGLLTCNALLGTWVHKNWKREFERGRAKVWCHNAYIKYCAQSIYMHIYIATTIWQLTQTWLTLAQATHDTLEVSIYCFKFRPEAKYLLRKPMQNDPSSSPSPVEACKIDKATWPF